MSKNLISIIMGSLSDLGTVSEAINILKKFKVGFEVKVFGEGKLGVADSAS